MATAAGARHEHDTGFGRGGRGSCGVFGLAVHDALAVEEELRDVGEGGGVATRDAAAGEVFQEIGKEEIDCGGLGEISCAGEQISGYGFDGLGTLGFGLGNSSFGGGGGLGPGVEGAEPRMIWG